MLSTYQRLSPEDQDDFSFNRVECFSNKYILVSITPYFIQTPNKTDHFSFGTNEVVLTEFVI